MYALARRRRHRQHCKINLLAQHTET